MKDLQVGPIVGFRDPEITVEQFVLLLGFGSELVIEFILKGGDAFHEEAGIAEMVKVIGFDVANGLECVRKVLGDGVIEGPVVFGNGEVYEAVCFAAQYGLAAMGLVGVIGAKHVYS